MYPAALTAPPPLGCDLDLVLSVGGLNPDGSVALYSNSSPDWVRLFGQGVALISTLPMDFNGGASPSVSTADAVFELFIVTEQFGLVPEQAPVQ